MVCFCCLKKFCSILIEPKYKSYSRVAIRMYLQSTQSNFYRLGIKCDINLLPYIFYRYSEACICSHLLPPLFSSIFLPYIYPIHTNNHHSFSADIFQMCMCIKNFWWTERGKRILKMKEEEDGSGGLKNGF